MKPISQEEIRKILKKTPSLSPWKDFPFALHSPRRNGLLPDSDSRSSFSPLIKNRSSKSLPCRKREKKKNEEKDFLFMKRQHPCISLFHFCPRCGGRSLKPGSEKSLLCKECGLEYFFQSGCGGRGISDRQARKTALCQTFQESCERKTRTSRRIRRRIWKSGRSSSPWTSGGDLSAAFPLRPFLSLLPDEFLFLSRSRIPQHGSVLHRHPCRCLRSKGHGRMFWNSFPGSLRYFSWGNRFWFSEKGFNGI